MAIVKEIELPDGVTVRYHRVVAVTSVTNVQTGIEVCSYTSRAKREAEAEAIATGQPFDCYLHTSAHVVAYDQSLDVDGAYAYLKGLDEFAGATDDSEAVAVAAGARAKANGWTEEE